jgi:hypothetical protein
MFKISARHQPTWDLMASYYNFVPNSLDMAAFESDMRMLNPLILQDSLLEGISINKAKRIDFKEQRTILHKIYHRRLKEFSAVYPFIFTVENALRSCLADHMEALTGRMDWWILVRDAICRGDDHNVFNDPNTKFGEQPRSIIRGVIFTPDFLRYVFKIIGDQLNNSTSSVKIAGPGRQDEFYYLLSLGELWLMIDKAWTNCRPMFCSDTDLGEPLTRKIFNDEMRVIKTARNDLYHSKPITNRLVLVKCIEKILNYMNFHLGDHDASLAATKYLRPNTTVQRQKRHLLPG